jgi:hypothetical protein
LDPGTKLIVGKGQRDRGNFPVCGEELNDKNERKGEDASRERGRRRLMVSSGYNRQIYIYRYEQGN